MPVTSLDRAPVKHSGLCSIRYFRHEDVLTWPSVHPITGVIADAIELKPGSYLYFCEAIDNFRSFDEQQKNSTPGAAFDIQVQGALRGSNAHNTLSSQTMIYHEWVLLVDDRDGQVRMVGNEDSGADFSLKYTSGTRSNPRKTDVVWRWEHPNRAPVYSAEAFNIIIGGIIIRAGCLKLIKRFNVGAAGAPMNEGDINWTDPLFANKNILVIVSGIALPVDDGTGAIDWTGSIDRHIYKELASDTIQFIGSVMTDEKIEAYAWS